MKPLLKNVSLEVSPKPLFRKDDPFVLDVFSGILRQWYSLLKHAEQVSLLWWLSDGTDLLVYNRDLDAPIEWMYWQGFAHPTYEVPLEKDPQRESLTATPRIYRPGAVELTGRDVQRIVRLMRQAALDVVGRPLRVGAAFDPGAEFSNHPFRYHDHPELLIGASMRCIDCTARLHADRRPYAAFPDGIPEGTPFGRFFGRQARIYLEEMGFDYLWLSNSFGYGRSPYAFGGAGQFFDGEHYHLVGNAAVRDSISEFWKLFEEECPNLQVECRGTDFTVGMNLVNHATPYSDIYATGFRLTPPPNTPWPALTRNHGLALAGYMSHIAAAPGKLMPLRFYTSDPWFCNSPWTDYWQRMPQEIYLTTPITRVEADGSVRAFNDVKFLSVDTSWGEVPEQIPDEVIPHIKRAMHYRPDDVPPVLWLFPFHEYHRYVFEKSERIAEPMAGDLLIQHAMNVGLPLSGVITTDAFLQVSRRQPGRFQGCALVSPVPEADSPWADALAEHLQSGGQVLLYGPSDRADARWLSLLGLGHEQPLEGELELELESSFDRYRQGEPAHLCVHQPSHNAGGITEILSTPGHSRMIATVRRGDAQRVAAFSRSDPSWRGGRLAWVRGTSSVTLEGLRGRSLATLDPARSYPCERLLREALASLGWEISIEQDRPRPDATHLMISRCRNGFLFAGYSSDPEAVYRLRTPLGAPLLPGRKMELRGGFTRWPVWHCFHEECRLFVEQGDGELSLQAIAPKHPLYRRRWLLSGLRDATVRFFPETGCDQHTSVLLNADLRYHVLGEPCGRQWLQTPWGRCLELRGISGELDVAWASDDAVEPIKPPVRHVAEVVP